MRDAYCTLSALGDGGRNGGDKILIFAGLRVKGYNVARRLARTVNRHSRGFDFDRSAKAKRPVLASLH